ncbi:hypothetical protein SGLAM104S_10068 [Streptomyces glaucescens]
MARSRLSGAARVARWADTALRPGRTGGTSDGKATLADATAERAARELGLAPAQVRADWDTARLAGLVEVHGDSARPGWRLRAWDRDDSAVLRGWVALFDAWSLAHPEPAGHEPAAVAEVVSAMPQVLSFLQLSAGPVPVEQLLDLLQQRVRELGQRGARRLAPRAGRHRRAAPPGPGHARGRHPAPRHRLPRRRRRSALGAARPPGLRVRPARAVRHSGALLLAQPCAPSAAWTAQLVAVDALGRITPRRRPLGDAVRPARRPDRTSERRKSGCTTPLDWPHGHSPRALDSGNVFKPRPAHHPPWSLSVISASGIELRAGARVLIESATFRVAKGDRIGLVGRNGPERPR